MSKAKEFISKLNENEEEADILDEEDIILTPSGSLGSKISLNGLIKIRNKTTLNDCSFLCYLKLINILKVSIKILYCEF